MSKGKNPEEKKRECLSCGKEFKSKWKGNRICKQCQSSRKNSSKIKLPAQFVTLNGTKVLVLHG